MLLCSPLLRRGTQAHNLRFGGACLTTLVLTCFLRAQQSLLNSTDRPPLNRPSIKLIRYEEDWRPECDGTLKTEFLDRLKCIPLHVGTKNPAQTYLSLGGEFRAVFERIQNDNWSNTPYATNSFGLERYQFHGDLHINSHARLFVQLESGQEQGRLGGPRPIDGKNLDFLNAFVELGTSPSTHRTQVRVGKQELQFGSGRLVAVREGPNVRQAFYAARITQRAGAWTLDAFAARPAKDDPGFFDGVPLHTTSFWGAFTERNLGGSPARLFDIYYFGLDRKQATYNQGSAPEQRQTVGTRFANGPPRLDDTRVAIPHYDVEAVYQFGSFGSAPIDAWTISSEFGATLGKLTGRPRIGLRADAASGDKDPAKPGLQTFNPLFPIGNYFGVLADTGPGPVNFYDLHPNVHEDLPHGLALSADWVLWWRQSLQDGVYNVPGGLLVPFTGSPQRFVGHRPGLEVRWQRDAHFYIQADYGVFFAGPFLRQSGRSHNLNYTSMWTGFKF